MALPACQVPVVAWFQVNGTKPSRLPIIMPAGYVLWVAATDAGRVVTCSTQDDGYGQTLGSFHGVNKAGELGRSTTPRIPGTVRGSQARFMVSIELKGHELGRQN